MWVETYDTSFPWHWYSYKSKIARSFAYVVYDRAWQRASKIESTRRYSWLFFPLARGFREITLHRGKGIGAPGSFARRCGTLTKSVGENGKWNELYDHDIKAGNVKVWGSKRYWHPEIRFIFLGKKIPCIPEEYFLIFKIFFIFNNLIYLIYLII